MRLKVRAQSEAEDGNTVKSNDVPKLGDLLFGEKLCLVCNDNGIAVMVSVVKKLCYIHI